MKTIKRKLMILFFSLCASSLHAKSRIDLNDAEWIIYRKLCNLIHQNDVGSLQNFCSQIIVGVDFKKIVNTFSRKGFTPLQRLLINENADPRMLEVLLSVGADPNIKIFKFHEEWSAVHMAAYRQRNAEVFKLLYEKGGNFLQRDSQGFGPADLAMHAENINALRWMYENIEGLSGYEFELIKSNNHYRSILQELNIDLFYLATKTTFSFVFPFYNDKS